MKKIIAIAFFVLSCSTSSHAQAKPNIIFILTDDMGYGDISCFNGTYKTPNIDGMAAAGRRFTNYYSAAPICSPSRAGYLTGMHPAKWNITSFLQTRKGNAACEMADFLDPAAPSIARSLRQQGYATAHFGKWHMGGGRDVLNAPNFDRYGFEEWSSTYESPSPDPLLTATNWIWSDKDSVKRWNRSRYFVDKALAFLAKNKDKPCYVNLWPDDVHTPWIPDSVVAATFPRTFEEERNFRLVLEEFDRQIGRLLQGLKELGMERNTIVVFTSDNGPLPNFRHDRSAGYRGSKLSLYEGGIRMPFIVQWPGVIPANSVDSSSVITAWDLNATFLHLAKAPPLKGADGTDVMDVFRGKRRNTENPIYWEYGRNDTSFSYPRAADKSPRLAVREGKWKLLMNADGASVELYDIVNDPKERQNLAAGQAAITSSMKQKLMAWRKALPTLKTGAPK